MFREHRADFEDQMVAVIADVLDRLGRVPEVPIKQLTESAIALYLHALCQEGLGMDTLDVDELTGTVLPQLLHGPVSREVGLEKWPGAAARSDDQAATAGTRQPARRARSAGRRTSR